jgi:methanogenic corrinoid protein MtbC1
MELIERPAADRFFLAVERGDAVAATDVVLDLFEGGRSVGDIARTVLARSQREVGRRWEEAAWTVAQEHAATAVADAALATLLWTASNALDCGDPASSIVVGCVENEWHSFPARLAAADLLDAGMDVRFLGPSLPAAHLVQHLQGCLPAACGLSCTTLSNLVGARRSIAAAHDAGVPVVIGGAAVPNEERAHALGADGWAEGGAEAAALIERWRRHPPRPLPVAPAPPEVDILQSPPTNLIDAAVDELLLRYPDIAGYGPDALTRTREDFTFILQHAGAALVVDDPVLFLDFTDWLVRLQRPRRVPVRAISLGYQALGAALGDDLPNCSALLGGALNVLPDL